VTGELPQRMPGASGIPHYRTTVPSVSLLIRIAQGLDEWAEHDRRDQNIKGEN
jgi:hypothetical protein